MRKFQHYKGGIYELICVATHSETEEELVIYRNEEGNIFARPYDMFFETLEVGDKIVPRFKELI